MYYVGDPVPYFDAAASNNPKFRFHAVAGRYIVLSFLGNLKNDISHKIYKNIVAQCRPFFDDDKVTFFGMTTNPEDETAGRIQQALPGMRYFKDYDQKISKLYGAISKDKHSQYHVFTLVLDPNLHVRHVISNANPEQHASILKKHLSHLPEIDMFAGRPLTAPILMIPNVFESDFCKHLMDLYKNNGGTPSGFMQEKDGFTVYAQDNSFKKRSDYTIEDEKTKAHMRAAIQRRILPEIRKAHHFEVSRIERYIVACYDANDGGFFRAHRDNTTPATMHRRFACTINLNSDDYEGGGLRFPEFGTQTYKPPTGGALIFSCSLLHEATPVTSGTRYCTLPFFFDEAAETIRQKNLHLLKKKTEEKA